MLIVKKLRWSTAAGFALVAWLAVFTTFSSAQRQRPAPVPKPPTIKYFFSDNSFGCECGYSWRKCDGTAVNIGCVTLYFTSEEVSCDFIPVQPVPCS